MAVSISLCLNIPVRYECSFSVPRSERISVLMYLGQISAYTYYIFVKQFDLDDGQPRVTMATVYKILSRLYLDYLQRMFQVCTFYI